MKDTSSFLDLALDDSMGFDPLGAFDDDVEEDAEEVTEGYLGTPHTDDPTPVVDNLSLRARGETASICSKGG